MTQTATDQARWADLFSGRNALIALALSIGETLHAINIYLSTTILPTVVADIGGLAFYAWNTTLFVVASIIGAAASSKLLQSCGARKAYLIAVLLLFVGSALAAMAPNMQVMLLGRTIQGAGGGTLLALGYAVVPLVFPERLWQRAFALMSGMWGVATLFGPAIGGVFAELNMWRLTFGVMLPVIALYGLLVLKVLPSSGKTGAVVRLPILQLVLLTLAVLAVAGASTLESLTVNLVAVGIALVLLAMMIRVEKSAPVRLLPRAAIQPSSTLFAIFATMFLLLVGISSEIFLPYFLQALHGLSPLLAGYIASMVAIGWAGSELMSARYTGRAAERAIRLGPVATAVGLALLIWLVPQSSEGLSLITGLISAALILIGFGIGVGWPHLTTLVFKVTPAEDQGLAAASLTTVIMFASALGASLAGMLANLTGFNGATEPAVLSFSAFWLQLVFTLIAVLAVVSAAAVVKRSQ